MTPPRPIDLSGLRWTGTRAACPSCGRPTALLFVTLAGALACSRCAPITPQKPCT
jgi:hypothetical protein